MRSILAIVVMLVGGATFAQKPNINKAKAAFDKGELGEAKTIIDQAIEYEKTKYKAKTWYYRGMIYAALDTANNEPNAMKVSLESFAKALKKDPEQKTLTELTASGIVNIDSKLQGYYAYYYNAAIEDYQAEEFNKAATNFEKAFMILPSDTNSIVNAAYAATSAEDNAKAEANFNKALKAGAKEKGIFLRLYNFALQKEDLDQALEVITKGKAAYPNDVDFQKFEINILIQQDKIDEAKSGIEKAIASEPNNPDLYFSLGVIKEELDDIEGAMSSYEKAIEADPNHFNSNFNIGVMVFNECNELIKKRNSLSYKEEKKYDELTVKINDQLNAALPYWEKLYDLNSTDETVLETLSYIYTNLKMNDKAEKLADELDAVRG
ncbi:MAG: tetratricopeptide repeat protein [Bacteroidota bacterium]